MLWEETLRMFLASSSIEVIQQNKIHTIILHGHCTYCRTNTTGFASLWDQSISCFPECPAEGFTSKIYNPKISQIFSQSDWNLTRAYDNLSKIEEFLDPGKFQDFPILMRLKNKFQDSNSSMNRKSRFRFNLTQMPNRILNRKCSWHWRNGKPYIGSTYVKSGHGLLWQCYSPSKNDLTSLWKVFGSSRYAGCRPFLICKNLLFGAFLMRALVFWPALSSSPQTTRIGKERDL